MKHHQPQFWIILVLLTLTLALTSCGGGGGGGVDTSGGDTSTPTGGTDPGDGGTTAIELEYIQFNVGQEYLNIVEGLTFPATVQGVYSDNSKKDFTSKVEWRSSNTDIFTVSTAGTVQSRNTGVGILSAKYSGLPTIYLPVTINQKSIIALKIAPAPPTDQEVLTVNSASTTVFNAAAKYDNYTEETIAENVVWSLVDPSGKAIINRFSGELTPFDSTSDNLKIRADYLGFNDEISAKIESMDLESIELKLFQGDFPATTDHPVALGIVEAETARVVAIATYSQVSGSTTTCDITNNVTWTLSDTSNAKILQNGKIYDTTVNSGTSSIITIDIDGYESVSHNTVTLTVLQKELETIEFIQPVTDTVINTRFQLTAVGIYNNGESEDLTKSTSNSVWESSDGALITVNSAENRGLVKTGSLAGMAEISVKKCVDGGSGCYSNPDSYLTQSTTVSVHNLTPTALKIEPIGVSATNLGSIPIDMSDPVPLGIQTYLTIKGTYDDATIGEVDLSRDGNVLLTASGTGIQLCENADVSDDSRIDPCWVKITDSAALGTITATYAPTEISTDAGNNLDLSGMEKQVFSFTINEGDIISNAVERDVITIQKDTTKTLWISQTYSDSTSPELSAIDSATGLIWSYTTDGGMFTYDNDFVTISSDGALTGIAVGDIIARASLNSYFGQIDRLIEIRVIPSEITLNEEYIGTIDSEGEIYLHYRFDEVGDYTFTFISEEKTTLSPVNPGATWIFMDEPFFECQLGHSKPRVSFTFDATGDYTFGFDNLDYYESGEETVFSLTITKGGGYDCE